MLNQYFINIEVFKNMKRLSILLLFFITSLTLLGQTKLRDSVLVKSDIFVVMYSEVLEQPLWVKYNVKCPNGTASRSGLDFFTCDSIRTSDNKDYVNNVYDKGHMAPAADFNCDRVMITKTFSYLNCSLQQQDLNRTTWRLLEAYERTLSSTNPKVEVEIKCIYSKTSIKLPTGATVPDAYIKTIKYGKTTEVYYFKNEKPSSTDFKKYRIK
jgi:endonuclease G